MHKASIFYMCAGLSFAYSFASKHPDRTTGNIVGVSSWILRSSPAEGDKTGEKTENKAPKIHSFIHRLAMNGVLGPKWFVSSMASGSINNMHGLMGIIPAPFIVNQFKRKLSHQEQREFDEQYGESEGVEFVEDLKWINGDGDGNGSEFVNTKGANCKLPCNNDGNSNDVSVCLTTQQNLGLMYNKTIPEQQQILLWHGTNDHMISVEGSAYLASALPNAKLHRVCDGTHQGTMLFFPRGVMVALNMLSSNE